MIRPHERILPTPRGLTERASSRSQVWRAANWANRLLHSCFVCPLFQLWHCYAVHSSFWRGCALWLWPICNTSFIHVCLSYLQNHCETFQVFRMLINICLHRSLPVETKDMTCVITTITASVYHLICPTEALEQWPVLCILRIFRNVLVLSVCVRNCVCCSEYNRLSLSRIPRDSLKHFEISAPRHIRVERVSKIINWTTTFNIWICILTPEVRNIRVYIK